MKSKLFRPGIIYALLSCMLFSLNTIAVAVLIPKIGIYTLSTTRFFMLALAGFPGIVKNPEYLSALKKKEYLLLILMSISLGSMTLFSNLAFNYLPPLDINSLYNTHPAWMAVIACIFLKEKCDPYKAVIVLTIIGCVILICQPEFIFGFVSDVTPTDRLIGSALSISAAILTSISNAIIRSLKHLQLCVINFVQGILIAFVFIAIFFNVMPLPTTIRDSLLFVFCSFCGSGAQLLNTAALKTEEVSLITAIGPLEIVMLMVLQIIILGLIPNWINILGSLILVVCIVLLTLKDVIKEKFQQCRNNEETITMLT